MVSAYFKKNGLVSQQISSYNRFLSFNLQEIVNENGEVQVEETPQYILGKHTQHIFGMIPNFGEFVRLLNHLIGRHQGDTSAHNVYEVKFGQVHVQDSPLINEADDKLSPLFPHEARMRNLTYSVEIFADFTFSKLELENYYV